MIAAPLDGARARHLLEMLALDAQGIVGNAGLAAIADSCGDRRVRVAAHAIESAIADGVPLSAALAPHLPRSLLAAVESGARRGDLPAGIASARQQATYRQIRGRWLGQPLVLPLAAAIAAWSIAGLGMTLLGPGVRALQGELASWDAVAPAIEAGWLERHTFVVAGIGLVIGVGPLFGALALPWLLRSKWLGRILDACPVLGSALRLEAEGQFGESLCDLLESSVPSGPAIRLAAAELESAAWAARFGSVARAAEAGESLPVALRTAGCSPMLAESFAADSISPGGELSLARHEAAERQRLAAEQWRPLGAGLAIWGWLAATIPAVALLVTVLLPLLGAAP